MCLDGAAGVISVLKGMIVKQKRMEAPVLPSDQIYRKYRNIKNCLGDSEMTEALYDVQE